MDCRTKIAAAWWTDALRGKSPHHEDEGRSTPAGLESPELTAQQLEAFEAALAREIGLMLTSDLTHVMAVHQRWSAPQFGKAAAACGINDIQDRLPNGAVMRIFPNTIMTHVGPQAQVEILWSQHKSLDTGHSSSQKFAA
jgi:hypothetical protein